MILVAVVLIIVFQHSAGDGYAGSGLFRRTLYLGGMDLLACAICDGYCKGGLLIAILIAQVAAPIDRHVLAVHSSERVVGDD